jgi:hypothetical protein
MPTQVHASAPYVITPNAIEYATIRCRSAYRDNHAPFSNRILGVMWRPQTIIVRQKWLFGKVLRSGHYFGKPAPVAGTLCNQFSFHPTRARAWQSVLHSSFAVRGLHVPSGAVPWLSFCRVLQIHPFNMASQQHLAVGIVR